MEPFSLRLRKLWREKNKRGVESVRAAEDNGVNQQIQDQSLITCKCAALMKPSGITFKSRNLEFWTGATNAAVLALFLCEKTF